MVPDDARTLAEQWEPLPRHAKAELLAHTQARATKFRRKFHEAKGQLDRHRYSSIGTTKSIVYNISRLRSQLEAMMNSVTEYTPPPVLGHSQNALSVEELKSLQDAQGFLMTVAEAQDGIDQKFNEEAATGMRNKAYLLAKVKKETGALREAFAAMLPAAERQLQSGIRAVVDAADGNLEHEKRWMAAAADAGKEAARWEDEALNGLQNAVGSTGISLPPVEDKLAYAQQLT